LKFSDDEFDLENIIKETEKQRKLNKEKIKNYFEWEDNRIKRYFINLRMTNSIFSKFYKKYLEDYLFPENLEDYIYFKDKQIFKEKRNLYKNKNDEISFFGVILYFPKMILSKFMKMSNGRKLTIFIIMSFISYLVLVISNLLRNKECEK